MNEQKKLTPELEKRVQQAVENFMQGYGCCQSVVAAFADMYGTLLKDEGMSLSASIRLAVLTIPVAEATCSRHPFFPQLQLSVSPSTSGR